MRTNLVIPTLEGAEPVRLRLRWTTHHEHSHHGAGAVLDAEGKVLTPEEFAALVDECGAAIETTHPERIRGALGLRDDNPDIWEA